MHEYFTMMFMVRVQVAQRRPQPSFLPTITNRMSDLLNVGNRCTVCSQIDFLPISCPACKQTLCKDHIQAEDHSCPASKPYDLSESSTKIQRCVLDGCRNPSLNAYGSLSGKPTCTSCQGSFCVEYIFTDTLCDFLTFSPQT